MSAESLSARSSRRTARFLPADERDLFVWHHEPAHPRIRRGASVVLCPPLGYDYTCAYRSWRILADTLAANGFDAFRFDYDGTGNSSGHFAEPNRVDACLRSIDAVVRAARATANAPPVALVGLRFGATLALHAAAASGIERVVLWSPFASGQAGIKELTAFARLMKRESEAIASDTGDIHAAGYIVTAATANDLRRLHPDALTTSPAPKILVVHRDDLPEDGRLPRRLEALGAEVIETRPPGTREMLADPALSKVPEAIIGEITTWLTLWRGPGGPPSPSLPHAGDHASMGRGYQERVVRFADGGRLFGILAVPDRASSAGCNIVLLNTGAEHHIGPQRLYVPMSRDWAADGHVVLRYDLGGIGDSAAPAGARENVPYPAHALDDLREALTFIQRESPGRPTIVAGLCSGGWTSFMAAREGLNVDAIAAINPPLYLRDGADGIARLGEYEEMARYQRSLLNRATWAKVLSGRAAYRTFARLALATGRRKFLHGAGLIFGGRWRFGLARDLDTIARRGIDALFLFSRGDGGLDYFELYGRQALRRRAVSRHIRQMVVDGAGHTFRPPRSQETLRELVNQFVADVAARSASRVRDSGP